MTKIWDYKSNDNDMLAIQVAKDPNITYTKPEMAKYLIDRITFEEGDLVMEPCFGNGSFYNAIPDDVYKTYCEINMDKDYLQVDITLSNPPFIPRKLFWNFHQKAMETTRREIWWLINISSLNVFTTKRIKEMHDKKWYLNSMLVVADKRWFGRYVWCKFSKNNTNVLDFCNKSF